MTIQDDFRLVTANAKIFNAPGSIYHIEADRLEVWGLDQISKASSTVIQYETDWNIEIEKDDVEDDAEDFSMAVDGAADMEERSRSPSVSLHGGSHPAMLRRGPRGPYNRASKENPGGTTSESIDAEGRLPGSKDGLGAFPPGSDWARTMLALKLKGRSLYFLCYTPIEPLRETLQDEEGAYARREGRPAVFLRRQSRLHPGYVSTHPRA